MGKIYKDIERGLFKNDALLERDFLNWYANCRTETLKRVKEKLTKSVIEELYNAFSKINIPVVSSVLSKSLPFGSGSYSFTHHQVSAYFEKADKGKTLKYVSEVNFDDLLENLNGNFESTNKYAGKQVFREFGITADFNYVDPNVINFAEQFNLALSGNISRDISSRIKSELIEGIKNFEGIPELTQRVKDVYDKGFTVNVPSTKIPAYSDGDKVIRPAYERAAYSYDISPDVYAELVARSENSRWFNEGTLNNYRNSGVVEEAEWITSQDERVCSFCLMMEGQIFPLDEASGRIPLHPLCRCAWLAVIKYTKEESALMKGATNLLNFQSVLKTAEQAVKAESAWALKNIADKVSVRGIEPELFEEINRRIAYNLGLESNYFPEKLASIKTVNSSENVMEMVADKDRLKIGLMRTQKAVDETWDYNKAFYKRTGHPWGADYWVGKDKTVAFIVDHELGHLLMDKIYLKNVDLMVAWEAIYDGITKKQIKTISETAFENINEFFAETYALYLNGKKNKLTKKVIEFFDGLELSI